MAKSVSELIIDYFKKHPNKDIKHAPIVDWVSKKWIKEHKEPPRDPWRAIRKLHQEGILIKVAKGVYRYEPAHIRKIELFEFSLKTKELIFKRDNYKCVVCGLGNSDGVEICADHIKPKDKGGTNTLENGQTLCTQHNLLKKRYSQTEFGKRYFIRMYEEAIKNNDEKMIKFCKSVFDAYDEHGINGHIPRPNGKKI